MPTLRGLIARFAAGLAIIALPSYIPAPAAAAPYAAGNRIFPATPTTEDPFVAGEAAFGSVRYYWELSINF